jgi:heptosyltransferase-3
MSTASLSEPRRILVIKNKHLGDILCAIPAFQALHLQFPEAQLDVLISSGTTDLVRGLDGISEILEVPSKRNKWLRIKEEFALAWKIIWSGYDLVVDLTWSDRAMWYALISGARQRWAIQVTAGSFLKPYIYTNYGGKPDKARHIIQWERDFLVAMGTASYDPHPAFPETRVEEAGIESWLKQECIHADRLVVVHPTSRWLFKCWHDERFAEVIDWLQEKGWQPVMTCGPSAAELSRARNIASMVSNPLPLKLGDLNFRELAALMRKARFFLGMDSAPAHLASAVGLPAVVLFGPSQVNRWRPYGSGHVVISHDCGCQKIKGMVCDKSRITDCLSSITVEEVCQSISQRFPFHPKSETLSA